MDNRRRTTRPSLASNDGGPKILLIHGRDELNVLRLEKLIRDQWHCRVVTLSDLPARGRTIIEKFEEEAEGAVFAMALLTPDDSVEFAGKKYRQARPNVTFELGWAYSRLGRARVCIVFKKGTYLPSDLNGINRIDFADNVLDVSSQLRAELESAGMLKST